MTTLRDRLAVGAVALLALLLGAALPLFLLSDWNPFGYGVGRAAAAACLYGAGGALVARLRPRGRAWLRAALVAWAPTLLGATGVWLSLTVPTSADPGLAAVLLLGPLAASVLGAWLTRRFRARPATPSVSPACPRS